ncbi:MAG: hypothetical protein ABJA82_17540 [Myxococcales bacterium]
MTAEVTDSRALAAAMADRDAVYGMIPGDYTKPDLLVSTRAGSSLMEAPEEPVDGSPDLEAGSGGTTRGRRREAEVTSSHSPGEGQGRSKVATTST